MNTVSLSIHLGDREGFEGLGFDTEDRLDYSFQE